MPPPSPFPTPPLCETQAASDTLSADYLSIYWDLNKATLPPSATLADGKQIPWGEAQDIFASSSSNAAGPLTTPSELFIDREKVFASARIVCTHWQTLTFLVSFKEDKDGEEITLSRCLYCCLSPQLACSVTGQRLIKGDNGQVHLVQSPPVSQDSTSEPLHWRNTTVRNSLFNKKSQAASSQPKRPLSQAELFQAREDHRFLTKKPRGPTPTKPRLHIPTAPKVAIIRPPTPTSPRERLWTPIASTTPPQTHQPSSPENAPPPPPPSAVALVLPSPELKVRVKPELGDLMDVAKRYTDRIEELNAENVNIQRENEQILRDFDAQKRELEQKTSDCRKLEKETETARVEIRDLRNQLNEVREREEQTARDKDRLAGCQNRARDQVQLFPLWEILHHLFTTTVRIEPATKSNYFPFGKYFTTSSPLPPKTYELPVTSA